MASVAHVVLACETRKARYRSMLKRGALLDHEAAELIAAADREIADARRQAELDLSGEKSVDKPEKLRKEKPLNSY